MRSPSTFFRSFSLRRIPASPATVAPLPVISRFDQQLTAELDKLRSQGPHLDECSSVVQAIDVCITTQKMAMDSFVNFSLSGDNDRRYLDMYLGNNIDMLDTCNYLVEKIEIIRKYVGSLNTVMHLIDGGVEPSELALKRALDKLESCQALEKLCGEVEKRFSSTLRKMLKQRLEHETEFSEIVSGSKAIASMVCRRLDLTLSFNSKHQLPLATKSSHQPIFSSWLNSLQELQRPEDRGDKRIRQSFQCSKLNNLQQTVNAARELQQQIKSKSQKGVVSAVERLKRSCGGLMEVDVVEERVKDLYKHLLDVRVSLLGILSQA